MEKIRSPHSTNHVDQTQRPLQSPSGPKPKGIGDTPDQLNVSSCLGCLHALWNAIKEYLMIFFQSAFATEEQEKKEAETKKDLQQLKGAICATPSHLGAFRIKWEVLEQRWDSDNDGKKYIADFWELSPHIQEKIRTYLLDNQKADIDKILSSGFLKDRFLNFIDTNKTDIEIKIDELLKKKKNGTAEEKNSAACDLYLIKFGPPQGVRDLIKGEHESAEKLADAMKKYFPEVS